MNNNFSLIILIIIFGCSDTQKKDLMTSEANTKKEVKSEVEIMKERMKLVEIGNLTPTGKLIDQDSTIKSTEEFKGKLLIIDFWATWCSPCIEDAPKFKELEKKYENDEVQFITISIDDEFTDWKEFIIKNSWKTDNYWFGMNETSPFFSFMYSEMVIDNESTFLIGLPKYVIISPSGIILNNNAAKPSNPDFEKEIVKLLEEHSI